jgi:hypothetical protein
MQFHISAETDTKKTPTNIHALNVSITKNLWTNANSPPQFQGVEGNSLETVILYVGDNYSKTPFKLPKTYDIDGNNVWIFLE